MTLHLMFDAAYPPAQPYPGTVAVAGYIGGNTPHPWTPDEWRRFENLTQFPIWVGYGESDPAAHAAEAVSAALALGWAKNARNRRAIILDFETEVDPGWVNTFGLTVWHGGFETIVYGSASTVESDPVKEGRWVALYNGQENIPAIPGAIGHQFRADVPFENTQVDLSVITDKMMSHGGHGPRHG
jgi:hypothetical protein